jgi:hypothetical protein
MTDPVPAVTFRPHPAQRVSHSADKGENARAHVHSRDEVSLSRPPAARVVSSSRRTGQAMLAPRAEPPSSIRNPGHGRTNAPATEASAYAKAIISTMTAEPLGQGERRASRPLPRPPPLPTSQSRSSIHIIDSSRSRQSKPVVEERGTPFVGVAPDLPRSLPPNDLRQQHNNLISKENVAKTLSSSQLPLRKSSMATKKIAHDISAVAGNEKAGQIRQSSFAASRPRAAHAASLAFVLGHERIQVRLLPFLTINSFLSLTGSSDVIRRRFSGETVGRWVLQQYGVSVDKERGRSWPNLTVWEGFCKSALQYR